MNITRAFYTKTLNFFLNTAAKKITKLAGDNPIAIKEKFDQLGRLNMALADYATFVHGHGLDHLDDYNAIVEKVELPTFGEEDVKVASDLLFTLSSICNYLKDRLMPYLDDNQRKSMLASIEDGVVNNIIKLLDGVGKDLSTLPVLASVAADALRDDFASDADIFSLILGMMAKDDIEVAIFINDIKKIADYEAQISLFAEIDGAFKAVVQPINMGNEVPVDGAVELGKRVKNASS